MKYVLFVTDRSRQEETLMSSVFDSHLDFELGIDFPDKTTTYALVIHDIIMLFITLSNTVYRFT